MSTCKTGKVCIKSYAIAKKANGRHCRDNAGPHDFYRCKFCGKWHVGRRLHKTEHGRPRIEAMEEEL